MDRGGYQWSYLPTMNFGIVLIQQQMCEATLFCGYFHWCLLISFLREKENSTGQQLEAYFSRPGYMRRQSIQRTDLRAEFIAFILEKD